MLALTLVHEMTHDNTKADDIKALTPTEIQNNYPRMKEKSAKDEKINEEDVQQLMIHMMIKYHDEMKEALESTPVTEKFEDPNLLEKFKSAITNNTAESFWNEVSKDEDALDDHELISVYEDVLCVHISMQTACLVEFFPELAAIDAECIARFAYDCYKYRQGI